MHNTVLHPYLFDITQVEERFEFVYDGGRKRRVKKQSCCVVDSVLELRYDIDIHDSTTFIFSLGCGGYPVLLLQQEAIKIRRWKCRLHSHELAASRSEQLICNYLTFLLFYLMFLCIHASTVMHTYEIRAVVRRKISHSFSTL